MDIPGTLTAIATAVGIAKDLRDIDSSFDKAELKAKLADVISTLSDVRMPLVEAQEELFAKDRDISKLREDLRFLDEATVEVDGYRYRAAEGSPSGHAFCPICIQDGRWINMVTLVNTPGRPEACPKCEAVFGYISKYG
ncbi:hypothetical protein [Aminobacter sp. MET-1]|uniref:hypothetical protein n=1 Tax=Aminobacter sp. MET-1 TaxID=2951085 RepID=UPI002269DDCE|nr:hypothetical protein [Aminobacter sp. MET-1]MCX8572990.1 hypothetical protein [Aminobacter sp. MET-1]